VGSPGRSLRDPDELLVAGAGDLGLHLDSQTIEAFRWYRNEILRWSSHMSLTALETPQAIVQEGFLDSLLCGVLVPDGATHVLDIGSGAGFPAIPVALASTERVFTLVEASRKKSTFLRHVVRTLTLSHVEVINARVEELQGDRTRAGRYDVVMARAVAPPAEQGALALPFLTTHGSFLAQLGPESARPELLRSLESQGYSRAGEAVSPPAWGREGVRVVAFRRT
jgi:16S rRNA (guanine527-N7)-methyltransferase